MTLIQHRRSKTAGSVPSSVSDGEFVINQADGALYTPDAQGNIVTTLLGGVATTVTTNDNSTKIANTSWVRSLIGGLLTSYAPLASPTFTGSPKAPTPTVGDSSQLLATTGFVANALASAATVFGQCRLLYASGTQLTLSPYKGCLLTINGVARALTAALPISNAGLAPSTRNYLYAYWAGTAIATEWSTTGHVTGSDGNEIKSGDATRTYLGMVYTNGSSPGQFVDTAQYRWVAPWHNRYPRPFTSSNNQNPGTGSSNPVDLTGALYVYILVHADEVVDFSPIGCVTLDSTNGYCETYCGVDGNQVGTSTRAQAYGAGANNPVANRFTNKLTEGTHTLQVFGATHSANAQWYFLQIYGALIPGGQ